MAKDTNDYVWLFQYQETSLHGEYILPIPGSVVYCSNRSNVDDPRTWVGTTTVRFEQNMVYDIVGSTYLLELYDRIITV